MKEKLITPKTARKIRSRIVTLNPGEDVGYHVTKDREEVLIVLEGKAKVVVEGNTKKLNEKQAIYIGNNKRHNIFNNSAKPLKYIYVVALE